MGLSHERRGEVEREIERWLIDHSNGKVEDIYPAYPDIPKSTFYRWFGRVRDSGVPGKKAVKKTKKKARALATKATPRRAAKQVENVLPEPVTPDQISPLANTTAIVLVHECIGHAKEALAYCRTSEGKMRNPSLFLKASSHMRASVETLTKVSERLMDAQKTEQVHAAIFEEIRAAAPDTALRIMDRIQKLKQSWGLS